MRATSTAGNEVMLRRATVADAELLVAWRAEPGMVEHVPGELRSLDDVRAQLAIRSGLVIGPDEPRPDLTIVVNNDDGGGIFGQLEPGAPELARSFERLFGTPHGVDIASLCAATRTTHQLVTSIADLRVALRPGSHLGIRVLEVPTDRSRRRDLDRQLRDAVAAALRP
jgi:hypothetical protein